MKGENGPSVGPNLTTTGLRLYFEISVEFFVGNSYLCFHTKTELLIFYKLIFVYDKKKLIFVFKLSLKK